MIRPLSTYSDYLGFGEEYLRSKGVEEPRISSERLLEKVMGSNRLSVLLKQDSSIAPGQRLEFFDLLKKRGGFYPLQYLTGEEGFRNLTLKVTEEVLIPRPETELMIDELQEFFSIDKNFRILDIGTGSGNIALSVAQEFPNAEVWTVDISEAALQTAQENAKTNGLEGRIQFFKSDLFTGISQDVVFDCILSNPPYISEGDRASLQPEVLHEPETALFGGKDGLQVIQKILNEAGDYLKAEGLLILEMGMGQGEAIQKYAKTAGFDTLRTRRDYGGIERFLIFRKTDGKISR